MEGTPSALEDPKIEIKSESSGASKEESTTKNKGIPFESNKKYKRALIHDDYGGQRMSGISTPVKFPYVFLFTALRPTQVSVLYCDGWQDDGTFIFTGSGQEGDMRWSATNISVRDHKKQRKKLLLFTNTNENGFVEFVGEMECKSYHNAVRLDRDKKPRGVFEFVLKPVNGDDISDTFKTQHAITKEKDIYGVNDSAVITLKSSATWIQGPGSTTPVRRKRSASGVENCAENAATKRHKHDNDAAVPKDVVICTSGNMVDVNTVRKRGRPRKIRPEEEMQKDGMSVLIAKSDMDLSVFPPPRRKFSEIIKELTAAKVCLDEDEAPLPEAVQADPVPPTLPVPTVPREPMLATMDFNPLEDNAPVQDDFELLLASPDLFDLSGAQSNRAKAGLDPDLSLHSHSLSHVHSSLDDSDLNSVNTSSESHLSPEQTKLFLDLPDIEDVMLEFDSMRPKMPLDSSMAEEGLDLITQQSSVYDSPIKSGVRSALTNESCHMWSSSPQLLTQESYILSPVSSVYN